jgi:hypothetical protein
MMNLLIYRFNNTEAAPGKNEMDEYKPNGRTKEALEAAMGYIQTVAYKVGLRWVFYRLLQDGFLDSKDDYENLKGWCSKARKRFYGDWHPSTLVDEGRSIDTSWDPRDRDHVLSSLHYYAKLTPDLYIGQIAVPFLIFEAETMSGQFEHFAPWSDRAALRGDASIPHKWNIAKRCDHLASKYELPVHILYFGDFDNKGLQIPKSAMADIIDWVEPNTGLEFTRCGINHGDAERFNLPEKSLKVGTYEWESLDSDDAGTLIREGLEKVIDLDLIEERIEAAEDETVELQGEIETHLREIA